MHHLKRSLLVCMLAIVLTMLLTARVTQAAGLTGKKWSVVPSPSVKSDNHLQGVAAISATNVWAVGDYGARLPSIHTLTEQWNGTNWQIVPSPNVAESKTDLLQGVTAISASNIWAVGFYTNRNFIEQTLIEQWNGTSWQIVPSPNAGSYYNFLQGVAAVSSTNIWAVGDYFNGSDINQTLIEHWNGTSWQIVASPNPAGSSANWLYGVAAVSATDIWAVGDFQNSSSGPNQALIEHWNGTNWQIVASPNPGADSFLQGVARVPGATNLWAVGSYTTSRGLGKTFTEFYG